MLPGVLGWAHLSPGTQDRPVQAAQLVAGYNAETHQPQGSVYFWLSRIGEVVSAWGEQESAGPHPQQKLWVCTVILLIVLLLFHISFIMLVCVSLLKVVYEQKWSSHRWSQLDLIVRVVDLVHFAENLLLLAGRRLRRMPRNCVRDEAQIFRCKVECHLITSYSCNICLPADSFRQQNMTIWFQTIYFRVPVQFNHLIWTLEGTLYAV